MHFLNLTKLIHCVSNMRFNVCYILPPAFFTFSWAVTALCATFLPFSCLFRLLWACILSFPPLLLSSLQPQCGRPPNDPQSVIYVQLYSNLLEILEILEIRWAPLSTATQRVLLSNEREASLHISVGSRRERMIIPQFDSGCLFCL